MTRYCDALQCTGFSPLLHHIKGLFCSKQSLLIKHKLKNDALKVLFNEFPPFVTNKYIKIDHLNEPDSLQLPSLQFSIR